MLSSLGRNPLCPYFGPDEGAGDSDRAAGEGADGRVTQHEDSAAGGRAAPAAAAAPPQAERQGTQPPWHHKPKPADTYGHTEMALS